MKDDRLTSDTGMVLVRELMERLGLIDWLEANLEDDRDPSRVAFSLGELLRAWLCLLVMGNDHQNAVTHMSVDPALKLSSTDQRGVGALEEAVVPSQPTLSRWMALLARQQNLARLNEALAKPGLPGSGGDGGQHVCPGSGAGAGRFAPWERERIPTLIFPGKRH